jgi:hypothetical protein
MRVADENGVGFGQRSGQERLVGHERLRERGANATSAEVRI